MTQEFSKAKPVKGQSDPLSPSELEAVKRRIDDDFFSCCFSDSCPQLLLVTGLPGSGKNTAFENAIHHVPNFLTVTDDMLRRYHPRFEKHIQDDPQQGARLSDDTVSELRKHVMEQATIRHVNVMIMCDPMTPHDFMECFGSYIKAGNPLRFLIVAEPDIICRQDLAWRFEAAAVNEIKPESHTLKADLAQMKEMLLDMADFVEREKIARRLIVIDQYEYLLFFYDQDRQMGVMDHGVRKILEVQMSRELNGAEQDFSIDMWDRITGMMTSRGAEEDDIKTVKSVRDHLKEVRRIKQ